MAMVRPQTNSATVELTELVGTQMFKQVAMAQVAAPLRFLPAVMLNAGDRLLIPGQVLDKLYILIQGRLQVFEGEGTNKPIGYVHSGDCVGLSAFIDRQPCHVTIVAESSCRLLGLDEDHLVPLINSPTVISRNLLLMLMKYIRDKAKRGTTQPAVAMATEPSKPAEPAAMAATPKAAPVENHVDPVTGCHNQRWLDETLDRLILRAATDRAPLSIVAVDVEDKTSLPADGGPEAMNDLLRRMAETLRQTVRPTDLLARLQNGTFLVMLPATDLDKAQTAAARVRDAFGQVNSSMADSEMPGPMSMAIGVVQMKAFVSGRKLVGDALMALSADRDALREARRQAAAEAAAAAEIVALAAAQRREEAEAEARRLADEAEAEARRVAEQAEMEANAAAAAAAAPAMDSGMMDTGMVEMKSEPESMSMAGDMPAEAPSAPAEVTAGAPMEPLLGDESLTDRVATHEERQPVTGPATFQPDTPEVMELSEEESAELFAQFNASGDDHSESPAESGTLSIVKDDEASPPPA